MRLLVTGAAGMLGSDVARAATSEGHEVTAHPRAELDLTDAAAVRAAVEAARPDVVVNCAAWTAVDAAESDPAGALAVNGDGARYLAREVARAGAHLIHVSTDYVFDGEKRAPYVEGDPVGPRSQYGISKLAGEQAVAAEAPEHHTSVRTAWLFGNGGKCFPKSILRAARERDELTVVDDQVGCPTFTGHLAVALLTLAETRPIGVVHVAGAGQCSWHAFAVAIVAEAGLTTAVNRGSTAELGLPAPRPAYSVLGTERPADVPVMPEWQAGLKAFMDSEVTT